MKRSLLLALYSVDVLFHLNNAIKGERGAILCKLFMVGLSIGDLNQQIHCNYLDIYHSCILTQHSFLQQSQGLDVWYALYMLHT